MFNFDFSVILSHFVQAKSFFLTEFFFFSKLFLLRIPEQWRKLKFGRQDNVKSKKVKKY